MTDAVQAVRPPRFPWLAYGIVLAIIVAVGVAPLVPVYIAAQVAEANNCVLNESAVHECRVGGGDQGPLLHAMGMAGWFFLITMPLAGIAFLGWAAMLIPHRLRWGSRQRMVRR